MYPVPATRPTTAFSHAGLQFGVPYFDATVPSPQRSVQKTRERPSVTGPLPALDDPWSDVDHPTLRGHMVRDAYNPPVDVTVVLRHPTSSEPRRRSPPGRT